MPTDPDAGAHQVPEDPQLEPEQAVDALEERVLGETADQVREDQDQTAEPSEADQGPDEHPG